ncbi:hypothetical protein S245_000539 [Arachis hypogaea]
MGGPSWNVGLGRRDSTSASKDAATKDIPSPLLDLSGLITAFSNKGFTTQEMVVLSGSHTIGKARCTSFRGHIYNDTDIDPSFAKLRQKNCPRQNGTGDNNLAPLDLQTPTHFENNYYKNLINKKGLLHSDQELFNGGSTDSLVKAYSQNNKAFASDFVTGMIKMGNILPLTGSKGEIRKNCRRVN